MSTETIETPPQEITNETPKKSAFMDKVRKEYSKNEPLKVEEGSKEKPVEGKPVVPAEPSKDSRSVKEGKTTPSLLESFSKVAEPEKPKVSDKEDNLVNLRIKYEETEKVKSELERRVKEIEAKIPKDYDSLQNNYKKLTEDHQLVLSELKKTNLSATPEFKEKYDKKLDASIGSIQRALATSEVPAPEFIDLIKQPESKERTKKISDLVSEMDDFTKSKISGSISEYDRIREDREQELSNPDPSLKAFNEEREAKSRQQIETSKRLIEDTIQKAEKQYDWLREGENEDWNKAVGELKNNARHIWTQPMSLESQSEVAFAAAAAPLLGRVLGEAKEEISRLNAELAKLRGATPSTTAGKPAEQVQPKGKGSFLSSFNKAVKGQ